MFLSISKVWVPTQLSSAASFQRELGSTGRAPSLCVDIYAQSCPEAQRSRLPAQLPAGLQPPQLLSCLCLSEQAAVLRAPGQSQMMALLREPPPCCPSRLCSVLPSGIRWCLFSPILQLPNREQEVKAGGSEEAAAHGLQIWVLGQDQGRKKVCQKKERR